MLYPKDWLHRLQGNTTRALHNTWTLITYAVPVSDAPDDCEAEVCMSHMDPVSGTDIDLFIEGIIPDSLHLYRKERGKNRRLRAGFGCKNEITMNECAAALPVNELKYLLLLELLIKSCRCCQLLLFFQALLVQVTLKQRVAEFVTGQTLSLVR